MNNIPAAVIWAYLHYGIITIAVIITLPFTISALKTLFSRQSFGLEGLDYRLGYEEQRQSQEDIEKYLSEEEQIEFNENQQRAQHLAKPHNLWLALTIQFVGTLLLLMAVYLLGKTFLGNFPQNIDQNIYFIPRTATIMLGIFVASQFIFTLKTIFAPIINNIKH